VPLLPPLQLYRRSNRMPFLVAPIGVAALTDIRATAAGIALCCNVPKCMFCSAMQLCRRVVISRLVLFCNLIIVPYSFLSKAVVTPPILSKEKAYISLRSKRPLLCSGNSPLQSSGSLSRLRHDIRSLSGVAIAIGIVVIFKKPRRLCTAGLQLAFYFLLFTFYFLPFAFGNSSVSAFASAFFTSASNVSGTLKNTGVVTQAAKSAVKLIAHVPPKVMRTVLPTSALP
jgi:hypothetical protein